MMNMQNPEIYATELDMAFSKLLPTAKNMKLDI